MIDKTLKEQLIAAANEADDVHLVAMFFPFLIRKPDPEITELLVTQLQKMTSEEVESVRQILSFAPGDHKNLDKELALFEDLMKKVNNRQS